MKVYAGSGIGSIYYQLVRDVTEYGRKINTRYGECLELSEPVTLVYDRPGYCWMQIPGRRWNPFLAIAEIFWILSGNGNVNWISFFSKSLLQFQDGNEPDFHGAYGKRIRAWGTGKIDQINEVLSKLKQDKFSRRAIINLWDPIQDNLLESKDYPCNNWVGYTLRDGVLDQTVVIRSNDLVLGTPMNAVQFTHLQAFIAGCLDVKMGKLTYVINNLHYYTELYKPALAKLLTYAFSEQLNPDTWLEAVKIPEFSTFNEDDFFQASFRANAIRAFGHGVIEHQHPYLSKLLDALALFWAVKQKSTTALLAAHAVLEIGEPLASLIKDFYELSENPLAQEMIGILRRKDEQGQSTGEGPVLRSKEPDVGEASRGESTGSGE